MKASPSKKLQKFRRIVWAHYRKHKRDMPWRRDTSLYAVIVSEIMLQQTQVSRVMVKFESWMKRFPTWQALASATINDVLQEWSGLGYNRRALYLKRIAEKMTEKTIEGTAAKIPETPAGSSVESRYVLYHIMPQKEDGPASRENNPAPMSFSLLYNNLRELPGIGPNTAGAILAYTYNIPYPFIETNIRSVYLHFFFKNKEKVPDKDILNLIEKTLADPEISKNPREWHWALMDYGSHLKATTPNPSRRSAHHMKQTPFKGSNRELRSKILRAVMKKEPLGSFKGLYPAAQIRTNLAALVREGFIEKRRNVYRIV